MSSLICFSPSPTDRSFLLLLKPPVVVTGWKKTASLLVLIFLFEIHIVPEVPGLFILEVVLLSKTQAQTSIDINPPAQLLASLFNPSSQERVFTPHPPEVCLCQECRKQVKEFFRLTFAREIFCFCGFGLVKLLKCKAFLGRSNNRYPQGLSYLF